MISIIDDKSVKAYDEMSSDCDADESECTYVMPKLLNDVSHFESSLDLNDNSDTDKSLVVTKTSSGMDIPVLDNTDESRDSLPGKKPALYEQDSWMSEVNTSPKEKIEDIPETHTLEISSIQELDSTLKSESIKSVDISKVSDYSDNSLTGQGLMFDEGLLHQTSDLDQGELDQSDDNSDMIPRDGHNLSCPPEEPVVHAVSSPSSSLRNQNSDEQTEKRCSSEEEIQEDIEEEFSENGAVNSRTYLFVLNMKNIKLF